MDLVELSQKFLRVKSISEEGNEDIVQFLIPHLEQLNAKLVVQQVPHSLKNIGKRQFNLLAIWGDPLVDSRTKKGLLLTAPLDTCGAGNASDWTDLAGDPFAAKVINENIVGLGAVNSKLNFLAMLVAVSKFQTSSFRFPLYLAGTCGGESELMGAKYLIQSGAVNPKQVVVGRPTNLKIQIAEKSNLTYQIKVSYVAVERDAQEFNAKVFLSSKSKGIHTAHANSSSNALENVFTIFTELENSNIESRLISLQGVGNLSRMPDAASVGVVIRSKDLDAMRNKFRDLTAKFRNYYLEMRMGGTGDRGIKIFPEDVYKVVKSIRQEVLELNQAMGVSEDASFSPPKSRILVSSISQDRDSIELTIQFHLLPEHAAPDIRKEIEQDFKQRIAQIGTSFRSVSVDCRKILSTARYSIDANSPFVSTVKSDVQRLGLEGEFAVGNTHSEAAVFSERGHDVVVFGAGNHILGSNCPNEKQKIEDLSIACKYYGSAIEAYCQRGI